MLAALSGFAFTAPLLIINSVCVIRELLQAPARWWTSAVEQKKTAELGRKEPIVSGPVLSSAVCEAHGAEAWWNI